MKKMNDEKKLKIASPLTLWWKRRQLAYRLECLDDHMLDDIGMNRAGIADIVNAAYPFSGFKALIMGGLKALAETYRRHEVAAQLAVLDDRILKDMGICRADIADIARGKIPVRHAYTATREAYAVAANVEPFPANVNKKKSHRRLAA